MPIHLRASAGDYARAVLCPGDPRRAAYIAERFFDPGARTVNEERGMLGFTGTFEGSPISVQTTGMGCPSAGIVFEELVQLGATRLIRVGTCGAFADGLAMGDTVIAMSASAVDTTATIYSGMPHAPTASYALVESAVALSRETGARFHVGPIVSSSLFYDPDKEATMPRWTRLGHLAVEMEAAMLYTVAAVHGIESLTMLTVSDLLTATSSERISDEELKQGVDAMMRVACRVAVS